MAFAAAVEPFNVLARRNRQKRRSPPTQEISCRVPFFSSPAAAAASVPPTARLAGQRGYDVAVNYKSNSNAAAEVVASGQNRRRQGGGAARRHGQRGRHRTRVRGSARSSGRSRISCTRPASSATIRGSTTSTPRRCATCSTSIRSARCCACAPACAACRPRTAARAASIVMLSSMAATIGGGHECVWYAAAKGAVDTMIIGVAREVAKEGIRINAISPGLIDTEIQPPGRRRAAAGRCCRWAGRASADEVAEAILFLLSDAASYINGANLRRFRRAMRQGRAPCVRRHAAYDRRRIPTTSHIYRGETWLRQCASTNTAVPKS